MQRNLDKNEKKKKKMFSIDLIVIGRFTNWWRHDWKWNVMQVGQHLQYKKYKNSYIVFRLVLLHTKQEDN